MQVIPIHGLHMRGIGDIAAEANSVLLTSLYYYGIVDGGMTRETVSKLKACSGARSLAGVRVKALRRI